MKPLDIQIAELETCLPFLEKKNTAVSQATVGWHIEHSLLALIKSVSALEHSNPADYKKRFSLRWLFVSAIGRFPRGRAKAPASVRPEGEITAEKLQPVFAKSREKSKVLTTLAKDKFLLHPVFGPLKYEQARKVISLHTDHHLRIIRDILGK